MINIIIIISTLNSHDLLNIFINNIYKFKAHFRVNFLSNNKQLGFNYKIIAHLLELFGELRKPIV